MIGTEIANYRIVEKLGQGGMGVVYKAVDLSLDRPVAVKMLNSDLARNPELVERFRAEARAQANLNHTNLATLYSFIVHECNAMMVMEFVDGETVERQIRRRGPIPSQEAIPLFKQALLGIGYAHRMGIIHRDLKPSNLMLSRNGIVKVMDFGIAKVMGTRGMTRTGTQMGTAFYMSPEQVLNKPVDIRSDIYSLGITLYEMLTAHVPFEGESEYQIMSDHVSTPPPPPTRFYPYIPKGVENAVLKAIQKGSDARFQTVEQFGSALEHPEDYVPPASQPAVTTDGPTLGVFEGPGPVEQHQTTFPPTPIRPAPTVLEVRSQANPFPAPSAAAPTPAAELRTASNEYATQGPRPARFTAKHALMAGGALAGVVLLIVLVNAMRAPKPVSSPPAVSTTNAPQLTSGGQGQETVHVITPDSGPAAGSSGAASSASAGGTQQGQSQPMIVPFSALRLVRHRLPSYPPAAQSEGITGKVTLRLWISKQGATERTQVLDGNALLVGPAQEAVKDWQFAPYVSNGRPAEVVTETAVPFQPPQPAPGPAVPPNSSSAGSSQGNQAQQAGSTPTPQAQPVDSAELDKLQDELDQLSSRARAAKDSVESLRRQQNAQGLNLRGDIAAAEDRMGLDIDKAQAALQNQNAKDARRYMEKAEADVETLEKFLGRR
jgi:serine/threonine-protein kinase